MNGRDQDTLHRLCEGVIEDRLTEEECRELKAMITDDDVALQQYFDSMFNNAALSFHGQHEGVVSDGGRRPFAVETAERIAAHKGDRIWSMRFSIAAVLLLSFLVFFLSSRPAVFSPSEAERPFASISKTTNCLWGNSTVATRPGARIGQGILRLEEGVALIHFDCGVSVSLEGSCMFELRGEKKAVLHHGRLVVTVESSEGIGFLIDTPNATIQDFGTKFGINSPKDRPTSVYVIDGNVEVRSKKTTEFIALQKGESVVMGLPDDVGDEQTAVADHSSISVLQIGTATGRGKEQWVVQNSHTLHKAEIGFPEADTRSYMLVKTSIPRDYVSDRKAIFSIDIGQLNEQDKARLYEVSLRLSYGPTGLGYTSNVPDSDFTLYGLLDESQDEWDPAVIDWDTFPGNRPRHELDKNIWKSLGRFTVAQGSQQGVVAIEGKQLLDFIRRDSNGVVTFAIARDTLAEEICGYTHGFANKFHNKLMPPSLKLVMKKEEP